MDERDRKPYVYQLRGLTIGVMLIITIRQTERLTALRHMSARLAVKYAIPWEL